MKVQGNRRLSGWAVGIPLAVLVVVWGLARLLAVTNARADKAYQKHGGFVTFCVTSWQHTGQRAEFNSVYRGTWKLADFVLSSKDPCKKFETTHPVAITMFSGGISGAKIVGADGQEKVLETSTGHILFGINLAGQPPLQVITAQRPKSAP